MPNSNIYKKLHENCMTVYQNYFNMTKGFTLNAHERMNTNDCYLKFKHRYEFVSNLDFDEIIFPRQQNVVTSFNFHNNSKETLFSPILKNYDIYNYAKEFFTENISSIQFEHVLFIQEFKDIANLLDSSPSMTVSHELSNGLFVNETEIEYLRFIKNVIDIIDLSNTSSLKLPYGFYLNSRRGKSIHNTDLVEGINQHYASVMKYSNTYIFIVPLSSGFTSHFRETALAELYKKDYFKLKNFLIDLEYYFFL